MLSGKRSKHRVGWATITSVGKRQTGSSATLILRWPMDCGVPGLLLVVNPMVLAVPPRRPRCKRPALQTCANYSRIWRPLFGRGNTFLRLQALPPVLCHLISYRTSSSLSPSEVIQTSWGRSPPGLPAVKWKAARRMQDPDRFHILAGRTENWVWPSFAGPSSILTTEGLGWIRKGIDRCV